MPHLPQTVLRRLSKLLSLFMALSTLVPAVSAQESTPRAFVRITGEYEEELSALPAWFQRAVLQYENVEFVAISEMEQVLGEDVPHISHRGCEIRAARRIMVDELIELTMTSPSSGHYELVIEVWLADRNTLVHADFVGIDADSAVSAVRDGASALANSYLCWKGHEPYCAATGYGIEATDAQTELPVEPIRTFLNVAGDSVDELAAATVWFRQPALDGLPIEFAGASDMQQVYVEVATDLGVSAAEQRECQLRAARRVLIDELIEVSMSSASPGLYELVLEVWSPSTSEALHEARFEVEAPTAALAARAGLSGLAHNYVCWKRQGGDCSVLSAPPGMVGVSVRSIPPEDDLFSPPGLSTTLAFNDTRGDADGILNPLEDVQMDLLVTNLGPGVAHGVSVEISVEDMPPWLEIESSLGIGDLEPGDVETVPVTLRAGRNAEDVELVFLVQTLEERGFDGQPVEFHLAADRFHATVLSLDVTFSEELGDGDGAMEPNEVVLVSLGVRNDADAYADASVVLSSISAGRIQGDSTRRERIEPGNEATFSFRFILPMREAESLNAVSFAFEITDERTNHTEEYNENLSIGEVGVRTVRTDEPSDGPMFPPQRVFIMEVQVDHREVVDGVLPLFQQILTADGRISITTHRESRVAISECLTEAGVDPADQQACQLQWANRELFDWAINLAVSNNSGGPFDLVLEVYDPHSTEMVFVTVETVTDAEDARRAMRALGEGFRTWLSARFQ